MVAGDSSVQRAVLEFAAELTRRRVERGLSKKQLAAAMGFDPSYVSHVEARRHRPTEDFARRAESVLQSGGVLWQRFKQYDDLRVGSRASGRALSGPDSWLPPGAGLVVEREISSLSYLDNMYRCTVRRELYNAGTEPVTRYPVRIAVDRYPDDPERSNAHHREHPLTWDELALAASCAGEQMQWRSKTDRDALKEVWLLFENVHGRFPLYPSQRTTIAYTYHVGADKWGPWFQRAVRLPTRHISISADFPAELHPVVWGVETSLSAESAPLRTPIKHEYTGDGRIVYSWHTDSPTLHAWYRLEWRFRTASGGGAPEAGDDTADYPGVVADDVPANGLRGDGDIGADHRRGFGASRLTGNDQATDMVIAEDYGASHESAGEPSQRPRPPGVGRVTGSGSVASGQRASDRMRSVGIIQRGAQGLRVRARRFNLPRDATTAVDVVARLCEALDRVDGLHRFAKGLGLSAPQIGLDWAAAVIRPGGNRAKPIVLLNPRIISESAETDEQYEGCLSYFDVRGMVARPLRITVESALPTGDRVITVYERALSRLIAHEVDHLEGRLYVDRMAPDRRLVAVEEYGESGRPWRY